MKLVLMRTKRIILFIDQDALLLFELSAYRRPVACRTSKCLQSQQVRKIIENNGKEQNDISLLFCPAAKYTLKWHARSSAIKALYIQRMKYAESKPKLRVFLKNRNSRKKMSNKKKSGFKA